MARAGISVSVRGRLGNEKPTKREVDDPFRLLLLADFSGRAARADKPPLRRPRRVDVAELDQIFAPFSAELEVPTPNGDERLTPRSLDDLHPDQLLANLHGFEEARELLSAFNGRSVSPETLARAQRYLGSVHGAPTATSASDTNDSSTLDRLLGRAPAAPAPAVETRPSPLASLLEQAVAPHKSDAPGGERDMYKAELERVLTLSLRRTLHSPAFRALEAAWRGADRVVRALDTDESLEIWLFDVSLAELTADLANADPEQSQLHRLLVSDAPAWTVIAADFAFGNDDGELQALAALGALSARAGGALVADAAPALFACTSLEELADFKLWSERPVSPLWHALRSTPLAPRIGLAVPRVLSRARYGKKSDPIDSFAFEELSGNGLHAGERAYSSAAFAVAELLGASYRAEGWGYSDGLRLSLEDLPSDTYDNDGERALVPGAELALTQRAAEAILNRGVMPFVARRDRAGVSLLQLASIAEPRAALVGVDTGADAD